MTARLIILGGGFTGVCVAYLVAQKDPSVAITLIEPRHDLGAGSAYSTMEPDHRVNAPIGSHSIDPADPEHLARWVRDNDLLSEDPAAQTDYGVFIRRRDYARYLNQCLDAHRVSTPGSGILHCRSVAKSVKKTNTGYRVQTADERSYDADVVVMATGNPTARVPRLLSNVADHPAVIVDPWARDRIAAIPIDNDVLVVGSSLTAADQVCSLLGQGHRAPIRVISRNGLRPTTWPLADPSAPPPDMVAIINGPMPDWVTDALSGQPTIRRLTRALRTRMRELTAQGEAWRPGFEELRNVVWQAWSRLPIDEKQRFMRRLRPWYDVYRFRIPPQTVDILDTAERSGQLQFERASLHRVTATNEKHVTAQLVRGEQTSDCVVGALINCTGFELSAAPARDSLFGKLLADDRVVRDPTGIGLLTDSNARCVDPAGVADNALRLLGPPTAGTWGDPLGAIFISVQVVRMLPDLMATLNSTKT